MIAVDAWLQAEQPRVRMIMQVHDELVFEVHKDDVDAVAKQIHQLDGKLYPSGCAVAGGSGEWRNLGLGALRFA